MVSGWRRWIISVMLLWSCSLLPGRLPECRAETIAEEPAPVEAALESEMLLLTNRERALEGLHALAPDEALTRIAREHSLGMARQGFISHELPYGDLETRMRRSGYTFRTARENVATARTITHAQALLMDSPPHQRNILADDVNRVGIGIVRCPPPYEHELYITEIFAGSRPDYQLETVHDALRAEIDGAPRAGSAALRHDPMLDELASRSVQSLNVPVQSQELRDLLAGSADELRRQGRSDISRIDAAVQLIRDPESITVPSRPLAGIFGTAVRAVTDQRNQPAFLVLTLFGFTN